MLKPLIVAFILVLPALCAAKTTPSPAKPQTFSIKKNADITVYQFDELTQTFIVGINSQPAQGPNYVDIESLRKAIGFEGNKTDFKAQIPQMIKTVYLLKTDLPLVSLIAVAKRKEAAMRKKH